MFKSVQHLFMPALCTALGAGVLSAVLFVQAADEADRVRVHTEMLASQALSQAGYRWARFRIDDDEGRLVGEAPDPASRAAALRLARRVLAPAMSYPGVFRTLTDATHLSLPALRLKPMLAPLVDIAAHCTQRVDAVLGGRRILFETGSSRLTVESHRLLGAVAEVARDCPAARLAVQGHTDATGLPSLNLRLSQARAEAVVAALVEAGVPAAKLLPQGLGASRPLALGDDAEARAQNRRIEFHWTPHDDQGALAA